MSATDRQLRHLLSYIGVVRDELRMGNWDIYLHRDPHSLEDVWAHTWQADLHDVINIEISSDFFTQSPEGVRNTVVHELVHAQHRDITEMWEGSTIRNSDVPVAQSRSWDKDFRRFQERFVSWITNRIEGSVPVYDPAAKYPKTQGLRIHEK